MSVSDASPLGEVIVALGDLYVEVAERLPGRCPRRDPDAEPMTDAELRARYQAPIVALRGQLNARLSGIVGPDAGRAGPWPPGNHLRRRLRFVGDAADRARANTWYPQVVRPDYYVRYPAPELGARVHVPYFFVQVRAGGRGICGRRGCKEWHPGPWDFMYGFSAYEQEGSTLLSPASRMAINSAVRRGGARMLERRGKLELHDSGRAVLVSASQSALSGDSWSLSDMDEASLNAWAEGTDPGMQSSMTRAELLASGDEEIIARVAELYDYIRGFGERVWELSRRTEEPTVFLSYRRADFEPHGDRAGTVGALARAIESRLGEDSVFWDSALDDGADYRLELIRRAESAWLLITLRGADYLPWRDPRRGGADWCRNEYAAAQAGTARIIDVALDGERALDDATLRRHNLEPVTSTLTWEPGGSGSADQIGRIADATARLAADRG